MVGDGGIQATLTFCRDSYQYFFRLVFEQFQEISNVPVRYLAIAWTFKSDSKMRAYSGDA
jgi:hypothetical protein